jgi:hypothetical protein
MSEDESPGDMSDDESPELEEILYCPDVAAIGTEGDDLPQPLLPQHWVVVVPGIGLFDSLASVPYLLIHQTLHFMVDRLHWPNHTFPNPYRGLEDSAG